MGTGNLSTQVDNNVLYPKVGLFEVGGRGEGVGEHIRYYLDTVE